MLRLSTPKEEGILQVSKWLKFQALLDDEEMRELMSSLAPDHKNLSHLGSVNAPVFLAVVSEPVKMEEALVPFDEFLAVYGRYVALLKQGRVPEDKAYRRMFSCMMTTELDALYAMPVGQQTYLIKAIRPTIQLQGHQFFYSSLDEKFHPMVLGKESVTWGIQFAYPQIYQDPRSKQIAKVGDTEEFPNTRVFAKLTRWMRDQTLPTPFIVDGKRTNSPIRIGKKCLSWIERHPQLHSKGIGVYRHAH